MRYLKFVLCYLLINFASTQFAQVDTIKTENIEIVKEYTPFLEEGKKINFQPTIPVTEQQQPVVQQYSVPAEFLETQYEPDEIKPLPIDLTNDFINKPIYVKAGYGNKSNPYAQVALTKSAPYDYTVGLLGDFTGLKGDDFINQNMSELQLELFGEKQFIENAVQANVLFKRNSYNYYGISNEWQTIPDQNQVYSTFGGTLGLHSNFDEEGFNHSTNFSLNQLSTSLFDNKETQATISGKLDYPIWNKIVGELLVDASIRNTSIAKTGKQNDQLIQAIPTIRFNIQGIQSTLGVSINSDKANGFQLFPYADASFNIPATNLNYFASWKGQTKINGLQQLSEINPFLTASAFSGNFTEKVITPIGLKASIQEHFTLEGSLNYTQVKNAPLFVKSNRDIFDFYENTGFNAITESKLTDWSPKLSLYYEKSNQLNANLNIAYHSLNTETLEKAFHLPKFESNLIVNVQPISKLVLKGQLNILSGMEASTIENQEETLPTITNANIGATYSLNEQFSIFLDVNNIANQNFERWTNYPSIGTNLLAGIVFSY